MSTTLTDEQKVDSLRRRLDKYTDAGKPDECWPMTSALPSTPTPNDRRTDDD